MRASEASATNTYLVECYWPSVRVAEIDEVLARVVRGGAGGVGRSVRPLVAVLVPGDGSALLVLEAVDEDDVRRVGDVAGIPFDRVAPAVVVAPSGGERSAAATQDLKEGR